MNLMRKVRVVKNLIQLIAHIYLFLVLGFSSLCQAMDLEDTDNISCCSMLIFPEIIFNALGFQYDSLEKNLPLFTSTQEMTQKVIGFDDLPPPIIAIIINNLENRLYSAAELYNLMLVDKSFNAQLRNSDIRVALRTEDIEIQGYKHLTLKRMELFVKYFKNISQLTIEQTGKYSPVGPDKFEYLFVCLSNIVYLSLQHNTVLGDFAATKIASILASGNTTLTSLNLGNSGISDNTARLLAKALRNNNTLIYLNLNGNRVHSRTFICFVRLSNNKREIILPAVDTRLYESNIDSIINEIEKNHPYIKTLDISGNNFDKNGSIVLSRLLICLQNNTVVKSISLRNIVRGFEPCFTMDDIFLNLIAEMVEQNETITHIDFSENYIRIKDLATLLSIAKKRKHLEIIY